MSTWQQIIEILYQSFHRATNIALELPTVRDKKGQIMPNYELKNDQIRTITIKTTNTVGVTEPYPPGDVFTVSSDSPTALNTVVGVDSAGNPAVIVNALVQVHPNITLTVTDSAGLSKAVYVIDIVQDMTPTNIVLDFADSTSVSQPVPPNPGP